MSNLDAHVESLLARLEGLDETQTVTLRFDEEGPEVTMSVAEARAKIMAVRGDAAMVELVDVAFDLYEAWAGDPQAVISLMPRLGEALRALDTDRADETFKRGASL